MFRKLQFLMNMGSLKKKKWLKTLKDFNTLYFNNDLANIFKTINLPCICP